MKSGIDRQSAPNAQLDASRTDEELVVRLAHGHQEGLGALYSRYAALIFHLAAHSLDRGVAEEVVQEVFLTVWRSAHAFDPAQGAFRPWLMRQAHWRILNALRRRNADPGSGQATARTRTSPFRSQQAGRPALRSAPGRTNTDSLFAPLSRRCRRSSARRWRWRSSRG
jgi:RNA polymerase sigma factor (sigma-70 family)